MIKNRIAGNTRASRKELISVIEAMLSATGDEERYAADQRAHSVIDREKLFTGKTDEEIRRGY